MIEALQRMVGPYGKPIKVIALTKMIPSREDETLATKKQLHGIIPFTPDMLRLLDDPEESYIVPRTQFRNIVSVEDVHDWTQLLRRFDSLLNNLIKVLSNIRKQNHYKILYTKLEEREIQRRHNALQEKLLEKTREKKTKAKSKLTDDQKLERLKGILTMLGMAGISQMVTSDYEDLSSLGTGTVHKKGAQLAKMLMQRYGLKDFQAAGMVGNFIRESGLIPYNVENSSPYNKQEPLPPPWGTPRTGYGWAQWTGGRLNVFIEKFLGGGPGKRGRAATTEDNWKMLTYELDGLYNNVIQGLKRQTNVTDAAIFAEANYEKASIKANDERVRAAKGVLKELRTTQPKAKGAIVIPEIFNKKEINYDTVNKSTLLSNFIVDKPTIIDISEYNEPLVIIPIERPIGINILKILFDRPFQKIERLISSRMNILNTDSISVKKQSKTSRRTTIPESPKQSDTYTPADKPSKDFSTPKNTFVSPAYEEEEQEQTFNSLINIPELLNENITPSVQSQMTKQTNIDTVSQSTEDIFGLDVYLLTQDIIVEE